MTKKKLGLIVFLTFIGVMSYVGYNLEPATDTTTVTDTKEYVVKSSQNSNAVDLVGNAIDPNNELKIKVSDLKTKGNPKGEGTFVYVSKTSFSGVERFILWLVINDQAYKLNSPSSMVTPSLLWPREAEEGVWEKTGLNKYTATGAIEIVFGK
jgi:hypothetical protein